MNRSELKWNGWGRVGRSYDLTGREEAFWSFVKSELGLRELPELPALGLDDLELPESELARDILRELEDVCGKDRVCVDRYERAFHAVGKSYRDLIALRSGSLSRAPDAVVYPVSAEEVASILQLASERRLAVIPYGGGSSVVGGVEPQLGPGHDAAITLDLTRMNRLLDLDEVSRTATFEAGIYGPALEETLQPRGYTLGHYPQSFEFSTLGGWIAARGAGQQSNGYGVAASWLVAARLVTPMGTWGTLPFPNSAAGPDLGHVIAGSEGAFGVITDATIRLRPVPEHREYRGFLFREFEGGVDAVRTMNQAGLPLATYRLSDEAETRFYGAFGALGKTKSALQRAGEQLFAAGGFGDGACFLLLGVEGSATKVRTTTARASAICLRHGGAPVGKSPGKKWYKSRFEMPYLRDQLLDRGVGVETLETSTTWANLHRLHAATSDAIAAAIRKQGYERPMVMCHVSHAYEVGASLYFTFVFPMDAEAPVDQWHAIKEAASEAICEHGGTISHHHGVGVDHLPWVEAERGELGTAMLQAMKAQVDPQGVLNPGKLID